MKKFIERYTFPFVYSLLAVLIALMFIGFEHIGSGFVGWIIGFGTYVAAREAVEAVKELR